MKISVLGYSGAGKSTLSRQLGEIYGVPVLHLDTVQYKPDWEERGLEEKLTLVEDFLNKNSSWIIDGTYSGIHFKRRLDESDLIIMLLFNRMVCLKRVISRYRKFRGNSRPDVADGCNEKLDTEFVRWVVFEGRTAKRRKKFKKVSSEYPDKTVVIKNRFALKAFLKKIKN